MPMIRLIYFSENQIDPAVGSAVRILGQILGTSNRNNSACNLTGALVFDEQWFVQALEGERATVWTVFERIRDDDRHANLVVAEAVDVEHRIFANWWMGLAMRDAKTEHIFAPFARNGRLDPRLMKADDILSLMKALAAFGLHRKLNEAQAAA